MPNPAARFDIKADDRTKAAFKSVQGNLSKVEKGFNTLRKVAFTVGGAAGLGYVIQRSIDTADALAKSADAADISTTALQELRFAAKQSGVEINQLDDGVRRFGRRLGLAAEGGGPAVKAFETLNIGIKNTDGSLRNTEIILNETITALAAMENQARRSALASQVFGDDAGPRLSLMMAQGTAGLAELRQEAHRLGLVLDEDAIRNAERAGDQMDILKMKLSTGLTATVIENAEALEEMTNALIRVVDWLGKASGEVVEFSKWLGEELASTIYGIADDDLVRLEMKLQDINEELNTIGNNKFEFSDLWTSDATKQALEEEKKLLLERIELAQQMQDQKREQMRVEQQLATGGPAPGGGGNVVTPEDEKREEELEKQRETLNRKFENLRQHLVSSETLENEAYARSQEILAERREAGLLKEQEYQIYKEELERQHQNKLNAIKYEGMSAAEKFATAFRDKDVRSALAAGADMTAGVAQTNKTLFDINKAFALANAAVSLPDAVVQSFQKGGGYPWGLVPAALMLAQGVAQINAIKSTSFTGKGGNAGGAPSLSGGGSGGGSTVNVAGGSGVPDLGQRDQEPRIRETVIIQGVDPDKMFSGQQVRDLIERVNESERTGVSFV